MPTRLVHLVIDAADPARLAEFWAAALGWDVAIEAQEEVVVWPSGYDYPDPAALPLVFVPVPGQKKGKNGNEAPRRPISASAAWRGPSWPTRKATSSVSSRRAEACGRA